MGVGPEAAAAADLADVPGGLPGHLAELDHGAGELGEEGVLAPREAPDDGRRGGVPDERHVGREHPLAGVEVLVVDVVEGVGRDDVQLAATAAGWGPCSSRP